MSENPTGHTTADARLRGAGWWLALLLVLPLVQAQEAPPDESNLFHVEVVVFAHDTQPEVFYRWPGEPAVSQAVDVVQLATGDSWASADGRERVWPAALAELEGAWSRLRRLSRYQPLVSAAWDQTAEVFGRSPVVQVHGGEIVHDAGAAVSLFEDAGPRGVEQVAGVVELERGRFLHLRVDIAYRRPQRADGGSLPGMTREDGRFDLDRPYQTFRIAEKRQIRLGQIQYFDHAQFGVLAVVQRASGEPPM